MDYEEKNNLGEKGLKEISLMKKTIYVESIESSSTTTTSCSSLSSSSQDLEEDDASSSSSSSSHSARGPLYELDDLMAQLPIKRGLSKYYNGKSQTFTSLADVESVQDLAKEDIKFSCYSRRMKSCKSFGGHSSLKRDRHKLGPKAIISKEIICKKSSVSLTNKLCFVP